MRYGNPFKHEGLVIDAFVDTRGYLPSFVWLNYLSIKVVNADDAELFGYWYSITDTEKSKSCLTTIIAAQTRPPVARVRNT